MNRKDIETRYLDSRDALFRRMKNLDRRGFFKVAGAAATAALGKRLFFPHSFQPIEVAYAQTPPPHSASPAPSSPHAALPQASTAPLATGGGPAPFRFAYISDSHLYERRVNERFIRQLLRAVDDINALDPQPDFVLFGGDLAQLGQPAELELGAQILRSVRAPVKMMVGEHDWFFDMGEHWQGLFGPPRYSFDHRGVHFVVLNSILEEDFWTPRRMTPMERMRTVAGLDNGRQGRFMVGAEQRQWLTNDLAHLPASQPVIVFPHSPLYKMFRDWNFWTDDADEVQAILARFERVVVIHGHTHQLVTNRIGNIHFHGLLSTAWPWPYAPQGLPPLTIQMNRANPFDENDGIGDGHVEVHADGLVDKVYNLWNRNPITVSRTYMLSHGTQDRPPVPNVPSY